MSQQVIDTSQPSDDVKLRDAEHFPLVGLYSRRPTDAGGRKPHENWGVATLAE